MHIDKKGELIIIKKNLIALADFLLFFFFIPLPSVGRVVMFFSRSCRKVFDAYFTYVVNSPINNEVCRTAKTTHEGVMVAAKFRSGRRKLSPKMVIRILSLFVLFFPSLPRPERTLSSATTDSHKLPLEITELKKFSPLPHNQDAMGRSRSQERVDIVKGCNNQVNGVLRMFVE